MMVLIYLVKGGRRHFAVLIAVGDRQIVLIFMMRDCNFGLPDDSKNYLEEAYLCGGQRLLCWRWREFSDLDVSFMLRKEMGKP